MFRYITVLLLAIAPGFASADTITNAAIDLYLKSLPEAAKPLDDMKDILLNGDDKEKSNILMEAGFEGKFMRTAIDLAKDSAQAAELETIVTNGGFESLDQWALVGDQIRSVVGAAQWVGITDSFGNEDTDITRDTNLFEYLVDESKPLEKRERLKKQLDELCAKSCVDISDMPVIAARYNEIKAVYDSIPKN